MAKRIRWSINVQVDEAPKLAASPTITVDAYDKLEIEIPAGGSVKATLQPGTTEQVEVLTITASRYHPEDLTYKLGGEELALDQPQLFAGGGMMSLFADDPETIEVTNNLAQDVTVTVLVGRRAVASP